jgi:hypothetical protein
MLAMFSKLYMTEVKSVMCLSFEDMKTYAVRGGKLHVFDTSVLDEWEYSFPLPVILSLEGHDQEPAAI